MALEKAYLNVKSVKELKEILEKVPNWFPICVSANNTDKKERFNVTAVVVNKTLRKRKVEFIIDVDSIECSEEEAYFKEL